MDLGIRGRKALVAGGSRGLGRACALSLAREGAEVMLMARSEAALAEAAREIGGATGTRVGFVAADFNTEDGRQAALEACPAPDIVVNNPGVRQQPTPSARITPDEWDHWLDVHFLSSIRMVQAVTPGMCARGFGRIVNISVSFIKFPQSGFAHSHAARLALSGAVAAMVRDLVRYNVTINTVLPGLFDTEALHTNLRDRAAREGTSYEVELKQRLQTCPAGRFADPAECGDLVAYICSAQAGFMTGQNIVNDGGVYQGLF